MRRSARLTTLSTSTTDSQPAQLSTNRKRKAVAVVEVVSVTQESATAAVPTAVTAKRGRKRKEQEQVQEAYVTVEASAIVAAPALPAVKKAKTTTKKATSKKKKKKSAAVAPVVDGAFRFGTVTREYESALIAAGKTIVIGVDEAGRGPLAGPVVAAAVHIPPHVTIEGINDSKILTEAERESLYAALTTHTDVSWCTALLEHTVIDEINILEATMRVMQTCVDTMESKLHDKLRTSKDKKAIDYVLVDGNRLPKTMQHPAEAVVKGDSRCYSIAAASIIAKVTRDRLMMKHHETWPQYNFAQHKGYGVSAHMAAIYKHGPCAIHRMTFAPMKHMRIKTTGAEASKAQEAHSTTTTAAASGESTQPSKRRRK